MGVGSSNRQRDTPVPKTIVADWKKSLQICGADGKSQEIHAGRESETNGQLYACRGAGDSEIMKIYTCAVDPYKADAQFFTRDSGLMCLTLRALGHESKVVIPASPDHPKAESDLVVRAAMAELTNPDWWKSLGIDAVAFVCEPFKKNTPMIRAVKRAGLKTCVIYDTKNDGFPYFGVFGAIRCWWRKGLISESLPRRIFGTMARSLVFGAKGLVSNYHAAVQSRVPDFSAYNTPNLMARAKRRERLFFWGAPCSNMLVSGYPVFNVNASEPLPLAQRKEKVVAVARWNAVRHKRPHLLIKVVEGVLAQHPSISFEIYGIVPDYMARWHDNLPAPIKARITLGGWQSIQTVSSAIRTSMILYCPSASEGLPVPVGEALSSGCTVVGLNTEEVPGLFWALSEGDGTAARRDSVDAHIAAVIEELGKWRKGQRDPDQLAKKWIPWFSAPEFCRHLIEVIERKAKAET